ncbi:MAG: DUF1353 domain-containing protein [Gallionellaceae bacterium]
MCCIDRLNPQGNVDARWLVQDGADRKMQLLADFAFFDSTGFKWEAKTGDIVDGASIPEAIWSEVVGTPFIGDYRRASVVHDVACEKHIRTSRDAHRMFYEAMLKDGTSEARALLFYTAVRLFGPQWEAATGMTNRQFKMTLTRKVAQPRIDFKKLEAALDAALGD